MEEVEPYDRSMSPAPIDINKLRGEEREADIISIAEDRRNIVSRSGLLARPNFLTFSRFSNVVPSLQHAMSLNPRSSLLKFKL